MVGYRSVNAGVVSKSYNLYDTRGNLAQTIDTATGNVVGQSAVSAWGEPLRDGAGNAAGAGYGAKFGYVRDGESGFYLCTLRYYDPSAGRWITRDPIGYAGGSNLYGYVGNDPVNAVDPSGLWKLSEPSTWFDGNGYQGLGSGLDPTYNKPKPNPLISHPPAYLGGAPRGTFDLGSQIYHGPAAVDKEVEKWKKSNNNFGDVYKNHTNKGDFDYRERTPADLYWINGGWHSAGAMGNFAIGFSSHWTGDNFGPPLACLGGGLYEGGEHFANVMFGNIRPRADGWHKRSWFHLTSDSPVDTEYIIHGWSRSMSGK